MVELEQGTPLEGGVASDVRVVQTADGPIVVKKALAKLKVAADWFSDPARSMIEVAAIEAFGDLGGRETVPEIVWVRPEDNSFAMRLVDSRLRNWKSDLLAGTIDPATARRAGEILGRCHANSAGRTDLATRFDDRRYFLELRIEPFFEHVAVKKPEIAGLIRDVAHRMLSRRQALVHGDFSPKNILADGGDVVILDFEVTHWGDPRFDVAFCLAHLMLKSAVADAPLNMVPAIRAFLHAYSLNGPSLIDRDLAQVTACLLLARLHGKSPVDYLDRVDTGRIEAKASDLLAMQHPPQVSDFMLPELSK
ncbi:aminoglycoside phosphotransferase family protein [Sphingomonas sp. MG17]|uniref:Aminoglycoside phosphotransferase family protein n=1 Tax=Sphingomonas tagetis TaxID=2949092 RepID=A0A9X2HKK2_9SPHN|nr:aminoglycoside phosphotransferase family protein [Sphingomonas tagetis]MCP3732608.1 aminoglycoside phosphotransferase family protein [Sphingomonas tagetis]